jgi:CheY-like chemotaxis protein
LPNPPRTRAQAARAAEARAAVVVDLRDRVRGAVPVDPAARLDSCLEGLRRGTGTVVAVHVRMGVVTVVGVAGGSGLTIGAAYPEHDVRARYPHIVASADAEDPYVVLGDTPATHRPAGGLARAALRATRARHGGSSQPDAGPVRDAEHAPATVVYLDDDPGSVELLIEVFRLLPAFTLVPVRDEHEVHDAIARHRPAVVLVDAWLRGRSTEGLVREIQGGSQLEVPAVAVLSADANASTVARFRRIGVTSYLSKPIDLGHLLAVVDALARGDERKEGSGSNARTIATFGN